MAGAGKLKGLIDRVRLGPPKGDKATEELLRLGAAAVPALAAALRDDEAPGDAHVQEVLGRVSDPAALPLLLDLRKDEAAGRPAFRAIGRLRLPAARDPLVADLSEPTRRLRAAQALGDLGDPSAIGPLRDLAKKIAGAPDDRTALAKTIKRLVAEELDGDLWLLSEIGSSVARLGDQGLAHLPMTIVSFDRPAPASYIREFAARALPHLAAPGLHTLLVSAATGADPSIRQPAVDAIRSIGLPDLLPALVEASASRDADFAQYAYWTIEEIAGEWPDGIQSHDEHKRGSLRKWLTGARKRLDAGVCYRLGNPASPGPLIERLTHRTGNDLARHDLYAMTGLDFGADAYGQEQARAWWKKAKGAYEPGGFYRAGHRYDVAKIR